MAGFLPFMIGYRNSTDSLTFVAEKIYDARRRRKLWAGAVADRMSRLQIVRPLVAEIDRPPTN